jgi:hypothetical protein
MEHEPKNFGARMLNAGLQQVSGLFRYCRTSQVIALALAALDVLKDLSCPRMATPI